MNITTLSNRLNAVAKYVQNGAILADIGSDHAYLPTYLASQGRIHKAIAVEVNQGPYESALNQVKGAELSGQVDVRLGDGLSVIKEGEVDTVVIAGMGGRLITDILEAGKNKLSMDTRLILQPNIGSHIIREWLIDHFLKIVAEKVIKDDHRYYEIIVAERTKDAISLSDEERLFGPILLQEKSPEFIEKWADELRKWRIIYANLNQAEATKESVEKRDEFARKIQMAEEVLS